VLLALKVFKVLRETLVILEPQAHKVLQALLALKVFRVLRVIRAIQVQLVLQAQQVLTLP
jgi:hypothetical protein